MRDVPPTDPLSLPEHIIAHEILGIPLNTALVPDGSVAGDLLHWDGSVPLPATFSIGMDLPGKLRRVGWWASIRLRILTFLRCM
jgi:hypothetical protein